MSTIPEVLVARHCKMSVFAFSLITNECIVDENADKEANHEEVIQTANQRQVIMKNVSYKRLTTILMTSYFFDKTPIDWFSRSSLITYSLDLWYMETTNIKFGFDRPTFFRHPWSDTMIVRNRICFYDT